ncbi:zinc phosphodiesterase, putative [Entamoeba invadens IP1]|uniref:ribonuclease Z n=1 Tax=Entamoeba invadens IP1 TaxID=370355 RepID=A0A0A1TW21_ENTIV|nr:zinc phosphodiesterase, putative [Entamoeba invadens IP1]ELP84724.1 zinc phosphodiesterase, putative [Entamoeba invadens IP1]|eukprot:XP_004184070.1 zinc phosphodiesterase, putative [Entamoeba invadens IP1]
MKVEVYVVGNGTSEIGPSFLLSIDKMKYIFNTPESFQRGCFEQKLKPSSSNYIFFTSAKWACVGEYPLLKANPFDSSFPGIKVHGPKECLEVFESSSKFQTDFPLSQQISFTSDNERCENSGSTFSPYRIKGIQSDTLCYFIDLPKIPGRFDPKKADSFDLTGEEKNQIMTNGYCFINKTQKVTREDVCTESKETGKIIIAHIIDLCSLTNFLGVFSVQIPQDTINKIVSFVLITTDYLLETQELTNFLSHLKCKIVTLRDNSFDDAICLSETSFKKYSVFHKELKKVLPDYVTSEFFTLKTSKKYSPLTYKITVYPKYLETYNETLKQVDFPLTVKKIEKKEQDNFKVLLLSTGGSFPSVIRDCSCNLVEVNGMTLLIDCGENAANKVVKAGYDINQLNCIYFTHGHVDHVYGITSLLLKRTRPITIICPHTVATYICDVLKVLQKRLDIFFIENWEFSDEKKTQKAQSIEHNLGVILTTKLLKHTLVNYGIKIQFHNFALVVTGDTSPCQEVADFCDRSDVVIHECNNEVGQEEYALEHGHSTPLTISECLKACKIKTLIFNHLTPRINKSKIDDIHFQCVTFDAVDGFVIQKSITEDALDIKNNFKEIFDFLDK